MEQDRMKTFKVVETEEITVYVFRKGDLVGSYYNTVGIDTERVYKVTQFIDPQAEDPAKVLLKGRLTPVPTATLRPIEDIIQEIKAGKYLPNPHSRLAEHFQKQVDEMKKDNDND